MIENMSYKLLLLDIDGTTVASDREALPSKRVIEAVEKAQGKIKVAFVTGRPLDLAQSVIDVLGLEGPSVFNGGAEVIDVTSGKILQSQELDVVTLQELVRLALPFDYSIHTDESQYADALKAPEDVISPTAKLLIRAVEMSDAIYLLEQLNGVPSAAAHPTTSWEGGDVVDIHITHEHATKRYGAERLITLFGLTKEQVIAVGDSHNDVPLLEAAGLKVAMGDAPDEVKQLADYVAPSLANDGVADVIERFIVD
jgi:HAD superfamily hydrolase (TIGR01484 family)